MSYKKDKNTIINKHGVQISAQEVTKLQRMVSNINRKIKIQTARAIELNPNRSFLFKPENPFFNVGAKSGKLNQFETREQFEKYFARLENMSSPKYYHERVEQFRTNYIRALYENYNQFDIVDDLADAIKNLSPSELDRMVLTDELPEIIDTYVDHYGNDGRMLYLGILEDVLLK